AALAEIVGLVDDNAALVLLQLVRDHVFQPRNRVVDRQPGFLSQALREVADRDVARAENHDRPRGHAPDHKLADVVRLAGTGIAVSDDYVAFADGRVPGIAKPAI